MKENFQLFDIKEPKSGLESKILTIIKNKEKRQNQRVFIYSILASISSFSLAVFGLINIVRNYFESGLSEYLSLIFSDGVSLLSYWQAYTLSVVESLPIFYITVVIASVWIFTLFIKKILKSIKPFNYQFNLI